MPAQEGPMATHAIEEPRAGAWVKTRRFMLHELRHVLPPTIYFFLGFNLILFTKRMILAEHLIQFGGFFVATTAALIVGKTVLVADKLPFLRRFDYAPLASPILFKTVVYTLLVFVVRLIEAFIHYVAEGGAVGGGAFIEHTLGEFSWYRFSATQLWIFVLFLVYVTASELNNLLGDGELAKIFFTRRSSALKSTRRARIRLLVQLSRLTDQHPLEVLRDPASAPHRQLVSILQALGHAGQTG
jgi:hypothetical protein